MSETDQAGRAAIFLKPGEGRGYDMGPMQATFKADGAESSGQYTVSEWWLDAHSQGPGAHSHPEDDIFFVIEGIMSFLLEDEWVDAPAGSFVMAPGGVTHDFQNRSDERAGMLNFSTPGGFENSMPAIVDWFKEHPIGPA